MTLEFDAFSNREQGDDNIISGGVMLCDNDAVFTISYVDESFLLPLGYTKAQLKEQFDDRFINMVRPKDRAKLSRYFAKCLKVSGGQQLDFCVVRRDGSYQWVFCEVNAYTINFQPKFFCIFRNSDDIEQKQGDLRLSLEHLQFMMDQTNDVFFEWNHETDEVSFSDNWREKYGFVPNKYSLANTEDAQKFFHPDDLEKLRNFLEMLKNGSSGETVELRIKDVQGKYVWCRVICANQFDDNGASIRAVGTITDINEEKLEIEELRKRAELDALTGLYNHLETQCRCGEYINEKPEGMCALFMIDIDNFKGINDSKGHLFGDMVLTEIADSMKKLARRTDIVGRIGGDEFAMLLKSIPSEKIARDKANALLRAVNSIPDVKNGSANVTCSIGFSIYPNDGENFKTLCQCADIALYKAKSRGKNCFEQYDAGWENSGEVQESYIGTKIDPITAPVGIDASEKDEGCKALSSEELANLELRALKEQNSELQTALSTVLDMQDAYIYGVDQKSYKLLFINKKMSLAEPTAQPGDICYQVFMDRDSPCEICCLNSPPEFYKPKYKCWIKANCTPLRLLGRDASLLTCYDVNESRLGVIPGVNAAEDLVYSGRRKILVVEDNLLNRRLLCAILNRYYDTIEAENGKQGLVQLAENADSIALIMLDIVMPVMDGYSFLSAMKAQPKFRGIPVIVTTQNSSEDEEVAALSYGVSDFVAKPYKPQIILHRIANIINLRETASLVKQYKIDGLTGLYTQDYFCRAAAKMLEENPEKQYYVVSADVDNFKLVNDILGKDTGDELLRAIGRVISDRVMVPQLGIASRFSADRFAAMLERDGIEDYTNEYFSRLVSEINKRAGIKNVQLSWGVYEVKDRSVSIEQMCDCAFMAAASIKGQYKKYIAHYEDTFRAGLLREKEIVDDMEEALGLGQFEIFLQPKYSISDTRLIGSEAVARWNHPRWGLQSPANFIPLFEKNGFITELDRYVWRCACAELRRWLDLGYKVLPISVNVSRADIYNADLTEVLTELVEEYCIAPELLHLEITESAYAESPRRIIDEVTRLRQLGFVIEMDDFGSGYSTLNMLREMPVDILKLDMKFIQGENATRVDDEMLRFVINLARVMNLGVVAEGVETLEQLNRLRELNCDSAQGYYFAKPMPLEQFEALINGGK